MPVEFGAHRIDRHSKFFQQGSDNPVLLPYQRFEKMLGLKLCAFQSFRPPLGDLQRFLNLKGEFV